MESKPIRKLVALPEMIRDEEAEAYVYPEQFQNQIYEHNGQYIHLAGNSHTAVPKELFDTLIDQRLETFEIEPVPFDIAKDKETVTFLTKKIEELMGNSFNNVNRVVDNMSDKIAQCVELKDLQDFRQQIEQNINQLVSEGTKVSENFDADEMNRDLASLLEKIESIEKSLHVLNQDFKKANIDGASMAPTPIGVDAVKSIVTGELEIVHNGLPGLVKSIIDEQMKHVAYPAVTTELIAEPIHRTLSLGQLVTLKESGYTVAEIKELKDEGLI